MTNLALYNGALFLSKAMTRSCQEGIMSVKELGSAASPRGCLKVRRYAMRWGLEWHVRAPGGAFWILLELALPHRPTLSLHSLG